VVTPKTLTKKKRAHHSQSKSRDLDGFGSFDDDEGGWITPASLDHNNFESVVEKKDEGNFIVGCITSDYAMQNVILQMGLNLVSSEGMKITRVKQWILWCKACYKVTWEMDRLFCKNCGHYCLRRISYSSDQKTGELQLHFSQKILQQPQTRGKQFSLPAPKGGRKGTKLILREDQLPQHLRRKKINYYTEANSFLQPRNPKNQEFVIGVGNARKNPLKKIVKTGKNKKRNRRNGYRV